MDGDNGYQQRLGQCLRSIRNQQDLSLADVEARSDGVWKAVVIGAYERGDRAITMNRLEALAEFYDVPVQVLLADPAARDDHADEGHAPVVLDVARLPRDGEATPDSVLTAVSRLVARAHEQRGTGPGDTLTLRHEDLATVARMKRLTPEALLAELEAAGVVKPSG